MNVKYIQIDEKDCPVKFNPRAKSNWEEKTGMAWADIFGSKDTDGNWIKMPITLNVKQSMILFLECIREGHRADKVKRTLTLDDMYDWAELYDLEAQMVKVIFPIVEEEKK